MARTPTHTEVEFIRFPNLPGVELRYSSYEDRVFRTHSHPVWSVGLIESGSTDSVLSGSCHRAQAGEIVVIAPGSVHACNPAAGGSISYRMFYLSREWFSSAEPDHGLPVFADPVIADPPLFERLSRIYRALAADPSTADGTPLEGAVAELVDRYATLSPSRLSEEELDGVANVRRLLNDRLDQKVTLEQLAAETNMSRSHLSRVFTQAEGIPPHTYQNQLRVQRAMELLAADMPLARVGEKAGFADQSHFTRVFRDFTGATPSQYQAANMPHE